MASLVRDPKAIALLLAATLTVMSNATISPALPGIEAQFADTPDAALLTRLLVTAPSLTVALLAPFAGIMADRIGRRAQLLSGMALYALTGTAGYWLGDLHAILASRFLLGVAVALIMTSQTALVADYFEGEQRGRFMGYQIAATNFGGFVVVGLAGYLAAISANTPFMIYGLAALYIPIVWAFTGREDKQPHAYSRRLRSAETGTWKAALAGVALLAGVTFVLFYLVPTQLPYYLARKGLPEATATGQIIALLTLSGGVAGLFFGNVHARLGPGMTPALGYTAMALGFALMGLTSTLPLFSLAGLLIGVGVGLVMPNFMTRAFSVVPPHRRGVASGTMTSAIFLGQFVSPLATDPLRAIIGYEQLFLGGALVLIALAAMCATILRVRHPAATAETKA
jgi:MFS family permease